jgi:hypothetical protein
MHNIWLVPYTVSHKNENMLPTPSTRSNLSERKQLARTCHFETCVTEFLAKEEIHTCGVHAWLHHAYTKAYMGATNIIQCVKHFKNVTDFADQPHSDTYKLPLLKHRINRRGSSERIEVREMTVEIGIGTVHSSRRCKVWNTGKSAPSGFLACWQKSTKKVTLQL